MFCSWYTSTIAQVLFLIQCLGFNNGRLKELYQVTEIPINNFLNNLAMYWQGKCQYAYLSLWPQMIDIIIIIVITKTF